MTIAARASAEDEAEAELTVQVHLRHTGRAIWTSSLGLFTTSLRCVLPGPAYHRLVSGQTEAATCGESKGGHLKLLRTLGKQDETS